MVLCPHSVSILMTCFSYLPQDRVNKFNLGSERGSKEDVYKNWGLEGVERWTVVTETLSSST